MCASVNPDLAQLQPYPFQRLRALFHGIMPATDFTPINLSIGEPKHATPALIREALIQHLDGLANYPATQGMDGLRVAIAHWLEQRYRLPHINPQTQVLPVSGSREALFAFAQTVVDRAKQPVVISPNPFYQIYEGAALLAGATPYYLNTLPNNNYRMDFAAVPEEILSRTQLVYVCSPGNPTGKVMTLEDWRELFALSDRYGFVIAADECYSEIYFDEAHPPLGALDAAQQLGRKDFVNLVIFSSLSKRSNVPGMRSGFVAGDAQILEKFLLYRTYHGCAMNPAVQQASQAAWQDEAHVIENRRLYRSKFAAFKAELAGTLNLDMPDAAFYYWAKTPIADTEFALGLQRDYNVTVLPGSFLAREAHGVNPGANFVRIALVASEAECLDAAQRIKRFIQHL
jgi:N-succinyldiaminopimelate aminotransferase